MMGGLKDMANIFGMEDSNLEYQPRVAPHFHPDRIILTKGCNQAGQQRESIEAICNIYPDAQVIDNSDLPHNRIEFATAGSLSTHYAGKKTLVFGVHKSALRFSGEDGNTCPNYWHFSPYGFCPYDCQYCYLAGTPGVRFSPTVKIFLNLLQILERIRVVATKLTEPTAFYLGKLQDALALDPLTGYSRMMIPFFAKQKFARLTLLTKSNCIENLLDLDHNNRSILSWSLNPPEISSIFEKNIPSVFERLEAMQQCADVGYPIRAVIMPIIPVNNWQDIYAGFLNRVLETVPLTRITLGQVCSYPAAVRLMGFKLGGQNLISSTLEKERSKDGRFRFPAKLRIEIYSHLIGTIKAKCSDLQIGLCLEEYETFKALNLSYAIGKCNCVL